MREIKFRAWMKDAKLMIEDVVPIYNEVYGFYCKDFKQDTDKYIKLKNAEIMQYTGLKDKNGKEVYEGDIVYFSVFDYNGLDTQYEGVVKFAYGRWQIWQSEGNEYYGSDGAFDLYWTIEQDGEIEIISNIHEGEVHP